jgi:superfamily II DNA or RNA helicase
MNDLFRAPRVVAPKPLRPYQVEAIEHLRQAIREGHRRIVLNLATGAGKTRIASEIFSMAREKNKTVAFCVPLISIVMQTYRELVRAGLGDEISIQQGDVKFDEHGECLTDPRRPIQLVSIQTITKRQFPLCDILIIDECHLWFAGHEQWIKTLPEKAVVVGLSATPYRTGLRDHFGKLIVAATTKELIAAGYLAPFDYYAPASPDLNGVKIEKGDYNEQQLAEAMNKPKLVADIVRTWAEKARGRKALFFGVDCAHAQAVQQQFEAHGYEWGYFDAYTEPEDREKLLEQLRTGEIEGICNVGIATAGLDAPFIDCIILGRPTRSEMLFKQIIGRGLRLHPGKDRLLVLDHSDTGLKLGLPDEIEHFDFIDASAPGATKTEKKDPLPKKCPACSYLKPAKVRKCPACGFEPEVRSSIVAADGELQKVGSKPKAKEKAALDQKQRWWSGLLYMAQEKGKERKWALAHFKNKFDQWPRGLAEMAIPPDHVVRDYVRIRAIAWAKRREKEANQPMEIER